MKLFELRRSVDETGVSGTGTIAQGVVFDNGWCALTWMTKHTSVAFYTSIDDVVAIHGHGGSTKVVQIADHDKAATDRLRDAAMMDDMENVAVEFTTPNHRRVNAERYELAGMCVEKELP